MVPFGILLISNSSGRANSADEGNTGAPGDNAPSNRTCLNCHGTNLNTNVSITVKDGMGNIVNEYIPGDFYTVRVNVGQASGAQAYGFQLVSEFDSNNNSVNQFSSGSANTNIVTTSSGRQYAEQSSPSSNNSFEVNWQAPSNGSGAISFYASGVAANDNGTSGGDGAALNSITLTESSVSSSNEVIPALSQVKVSPNPAQTFTRVQWNSDMLLESEISLYDLQGNQLLSSKQWTRGSAELQTINLPAGIYILHVVNEEGQLNERLIIQ